MKALLTFSLGPVQPFIAQARKTSDLWIGSYLLSALMRAGLRDFPPDKLLFPVLSSTAPGDASNSPNEAGAASRGDPIADLPNRFVALHESTDEALDAAMGVRGRIMRTWSALADEIWRHVFPNAQDATLIDIWKRQVNPGALFEFYWAVVPYDDSQAASGSYGAAYQRSQALHDARKRVRDFAASDEPGEKSTISGEREALHPGAAVTANEVAKFWKEVAARFPDSRLGRSGRERLDAVDVIKRFATVTSTDNATAAAIVRTSVAFPSTDSLAAASYLFDTIQHVQRTQASSPGGLHKAIAKLHARAHDSGYGAMPEALPALNTLAANDAATADLAGRLLRCDGEAFHVGSYTEHSLRDSAPDDSKIAHLTQSGPEAVRELRTHTRTARIAPPSSYYAVLLLDGDHMGQLLSGMASPKEHRDFSVALSKFAHTHPRTVVEGPAGLGRVVYAGGDDVLAFLPTRQVLSAAQQLRAAYGSALDAFGREKRPVTASAGVVIAHRLTPVRLVLETARAAEKAAKEHYGRDALVVSLLRRSGAITEVGAHWTYPPSSPSAIPSSPSAADPLQAVLVVSDHVRKGHLSPRFVYALLEEAPALAAPKLDLDARRAEIARLLRRQRQPDHAADLPNPALDALAGDLAVLASAFDRALPAGLPEKAGYDLAGEGPRRGMVELSGWLLIAAFLARQEDKE